MASPLAKRPFVLIVRDGWGKNPHPEMDSYNAVKLAKHPVDDRLMAEYPSVLIKTSGEDVGLPIGVMGNSEVGHQNIGAGRIVDQETMRITRRIRDGSFFKNSTLIAAFAHAKKHNSNVHILGLCSDGRVHSDQEHAYALLEMAKQQHFPGDKVLIHAITDGRDTAPTGATRFLPALEAKCKQIGIGRIATVIGRFYAMDRDNRWERVETAYELLTQNKGEKYATASDALIHYYANASDSSRAGDEFVTPSVIGMDGGGGGKISDNDTVIFFNYRGDRPREITKAFVYDDAAFAKEPNGGFKRATQPKNLYFATMAGYEEGLPVHVIFDKPEKMADIFGETLARAGLTQMRSAETEKFPHVTFFFDDYREPRKVDKTTMDGIGPFKGEDIRGAHSRKDIKTYDLAPEMSAETLTVRLLEAIAADKHDVYIINYANGDMVGHTGNLRRRHQGPSKSRRMRRPRRRSRPAKRRLPDHHRRPRQLRTDVGSHQQLPPHRTHDLRCAADRGRRPLQKHQTQRRRTPRRHRPHGTQNHGPVPAEGDDWPELAISS